MKNFTIYYVTRGGLNGAMPMYAKCQDEAEIMFQEQFTKWEIIRIVKGW